MKLTLLVCNREEVLCSETEAEYPHWTVITCLMLEEKHSSTSSAKQILTKLS